MATRVTLRLKKISKGRKSLYLDFYPPIAHPETEGLTRRELLGLYLISLKSITSSNEEVEDMELFKIISGLQSSTVDLQLMKTKDSKRVYLYNQLGHIVHSKEIDGNIERLSLIDFWLLECMSLKWKPKMEKFRQK